MSRGTPKLHKEGKKRCGRVDTVAIAAEDPHPLHHSATAGGERLSGQAHG